VGLALKNTKLLDFIICSVKNTKKTLPFMPVLTIIFSNVICVWISFRKKLSELFVLFKICVFLCQLKHLNMERHFQIGLIGKAKIMASKEVCNEIIYDCLCNGIYSLQAYGLELKYENADYKEAKQKLIEKDRNATICFEDVLMEMLKSGKKLVFSDTECGMDDATLELTDEIYDRFKNIPSRNIQNLLNEEGDADDCDCCLQTLLYGEIIFG